MPGLEDGLGGPSSLPCPEPPPPPPLTWATRALRLSRFTAIAKSSHVQVLLWYSRQGSTRLSSPQSTLFFSPCSNGGKGGLRNQKPPPFPSSPHPNHSRFPMKAVLWNSLPQEGVREEDPDGPTPHRGP